LAKLFLPAKKTIFAGPILTTEKPSFPRQLAKTVQPWSLAICRPLSSESSKWRGRLSQRRGTIAEHHRAVAVARLYYLVTEAHVCEQLAQSHHLKAKWNGRE